jgi:hypothetical protein
MALPGLSAHASLVWLTYTTSGLLEAQAPDEPLKLLLRNGSGNPLL